MKFNSTKPGKKTGEKIGGTYAALKKDGRGKGTPLIQ